jgi:Domain of unknown function (DUF4388)
MALTGELSDLSLAELIEFFCNQRKTGRLKVIYSIGPGYFYLQSGSVVHARIGALRGIDAVYYALTLPNASFTFSPAFEAPEHTINQPWTSVVLEGLRRMDEGVKPSDPFPVEHQAQAEEPKPATQHVVAVVDAVDEKPERVPARKARPERPHVKIPAADLPAGGAFFAQTDIPVRFGSWKLAAVIAAVALIVGVIAVPWGWYARSKAAKLANGAQTVQVENSQPATQPVATNETPAPVASESTAPATTTEADSAVRRQREARAKERARTMETSTAQSSPAAPNLSIAKAPSPVTGARKATVQVTYDENGRVTQASGGDATALRIARQKRFPAGKAGSATITIPIN